MTKYMKLKAVMMTPKTEATITLPLFGNKQEDHEGMGLIQKVEMMILSTFGGFTRTQGQGQWMNPEGHVYVDDVLVYTIAHDWQGYKAGALTELAKHACVVLKQECIYVRYAHGEVHLIQHPHPVGLAHAA